ncbi:MAG: hypothetical protein Fur0026_03890 [Sideroxydans sp.]
MNIAVTQCPACATRFNVSETQLEAREGLVRCGRCATVFNARDHLLPDEPNPQLSLPIGDDAVTPATNERLPQENPPAEDHFIGPDISDLNAEASDMPDLEQVTGLAGLEETPASLAQQVQFHEDEAVPAPARRVGAWLLGVLLLFVLLAQAAYFFRNELALRLPGLKPLLVQYCELLSCTVELPRDADLLAIESSELEADAQHPDRFTLHVLLRNHAAHAQALPSLELTLTDTQDQVIARRIFHPADYRQGLAEKVDFLAAKHELAVALHLATADLRPTGYRLLLFYPPLPR